MSSKKAVAEFRDSAVEELNDKLVDFKNELAKDKALVASGTRPEKPAKIRMLRRKIARLITIMNEKKSAAKKATAAKKENKGITEVKK